ncbi:hypothetical protein [Halostagnicola bangensis]
MNRTRSVLKVVFGINVFFLVMLAFSYPYLEPGTGSYVAATMTFVLCLLMLLLVAVLTYFELDLFDRI